MRYTSTDSKSAKLDDWLQKKDSRAKLLSKKSFRTRKRPLARPRRVETLCARKLSPRPIAQRRLKTRIYLRDLGAKRTRAAHL
jgi:hypothetical protein